MSQFETRVNPARQRVPVVHPNPCRVLEKQNSTGWGQRLKGRRKRLALFPPRGDKRTAYAGPSLASNPKWLANAINCCLSGWPSPLSHERIKAVATPILAAKWLGVRFFSIRLT